MQSYRKGRAQSVETCGAAVGSVVRGAAVSKYGVRSGGSGSRLQPDGPAQDLEGTVCNPDF